MFTVKCDTCGASVEVLTTPSGAVILPPGWEQGVAVPQNAPPPRQAVHGCGKSACKLVGHVPPEESKEETWGLSGTQ